MTLVQLKKKANTKLGEFWTLLVEKQDAYHAKHGKYFHLLITDNVVDGEDTTWELKTCLDEQHPIDVDFNFNSPVPFQISVDKSDNNGRQVYSATATVELPDGRKFTRTRNNLNEDTDWQLVVEQT